MKSIAKKQDIITAWLQWHFLQMPKFLFKVWGNYFSYVTDFFSVPLLLKTLFSPWRRYQWSYPKNFDIQEFFLSFFSNIISRFLGAIVRTVLIIFGFLAQLMFILMGGIMLILWILFPLVILSGFLFILFFNSNGI